MISKHISGVEPTVGEGWFRGKQPGGGLTKDRAPTYNFVAPDGKAGPNGTMRSAGKNRHWTASIDLGQRTSAGIWELHITPQDSFHGSDYYCEVVDHVRVIDDPMKNLELFQRDSKTTWNASKNQYEFSGMVPNLFNLQPLWYPEQGWHVPLLGDATSEFDAGVHLENTMTLDCLMTFTVFNFEAKAQILGRTVLGKEFTPNVPSQRFHPDDPRSLSIKLPSQTLWQGH